MGEFAAQLIPSHAQTSQPANGAVPSAAGGAQSTGGAGGSSSTTAAATAGAGPASVSSPERATAVSTAPSAVNEGESNAADSATDARGTTSSN